MRCLGQLSFEYLLLLAAVFSIFALLLPLLSNVYQLSLFGLDSVNAKNFSSSMQNSVDQMAFQADGSLKTVEAKPLTKWLVSCSHERLVVAVHSPNGNRKDFEVLFPNSLGFCSSQIESKTSFFLRKSSGQIILEYN